MNVLVRGYLYRTGHNYIRRFPRSDGLVDWFRSGFGDWLRGNLDFALLFVCNCTRIVVVVSNFLEWRQLAPEVLQIPPFLGIGFQKLNKTLAKQGIVSVALLESLDVFFQIFPVKN